MTLIIALVLIKGLHLPEPWFYLACVAWLGRTWLHEARDRARN